MLKEQRAVSLLVIAVAEHPCTISAVDQLFQQSFSLLQRNSRKVESIEINQIKDDEDKSAFTLSHRLLELLKAASSGSVHHYDLAVHNRFLGLNRLYSARDFRKFGSPILAIAAPEARFPIREMTEHSVSIEFEFVQPVIP